MTGEWPAPISHSVIYKGDLEGTGTTEAVTNDCMWFRFWRTMYCRFESGIHPRENVVDVVCTLKDHIESLDDHRQLLEMVIHYDRCRVVVTVIVHGVMF